MKIVYNSGGSVDLENPIFMEDDQLQEFIEFLEQLLKEKIEIQNVQEKERFINPGDDRHPKRWVAQELILLLNPNKDENELIKKLDRSAMSIAMQRAQFVPAFVCWAKKKGYNAKNVTKSVIEKFLEEENEDS